MALENDGSMVMPVAPMYGSGYGGSGFGNGWGGDGWWIILLFILLGNNGWNNGFCGCGGFGGFAADGAALYPWMNQAAITTSGFESAATRSTLGDIQGAITSGFGDVQTALCAGFAGVNAGISNGFAQAEIAENSRQVANMQQMFSLQSQLAQCCCDNRLASADLKYTIATENCADRAALSDGIRDLLTAQTASTQRILDQLCQDKIDAKNDTIAQLRSQINELSRTASQNAQTAVILANNEAQTAALEQYLAPVPRPAYIVQNPNCCSNTCSCNTGCGM